MLMISATSAMASNHCSTHYSTAASQELLDFIKDFNPFWGTWRGEYKGDPVVGEFKLDSSNRFIFDARFGDRSFNNQRVRLCYKDGKFSAIASGITLNVQVIDNRTIRMTSFVISGSVTMKR